VLDQRLFHEADRQLTICNACRYCEGLCPVFPALERRNSFLEGDILYLANLCHDCRACMPACPYTDPHEFAIDIPTVMVRLLSENLRMVDHRRVSGFTTPDDVRVVSADGRPVPVQVDGDHIGDATEAVFGVWPRALRIVA